MGEGQRERRRGGTKNGEIDSKSEGKVDDNWREFENRKVEGPEVAKGTMTVGGRD